MKPTKEEIQECFDDSYELYAAKVYSLRKAYKEAIEALKIARDPHTAKWRLNEIDEVLRKAPEDL